MINYSLHFKFENGEIIHVDPSSNSPKFGWIRFDEEIKDFNFVTYNWKYNGCTIKWKLEDGVYYAETENGTIHSESFINLIRILASIVWARNLK